MPTTRLQSQYPGITVASFDTTAAELEALTAELGVKALPQFRFYQVGWVHKRTNVLLPAWLGGVTGS